MNTLFDDIQRSNLSYISNNESLFKYVNRSATKKAVSTRINLEEWYANLPSMTHDEMNNRNDIRGRIRSKNDAQFLSASFELLIHQLLIRLNCVDIRAHPDAANSKHPDFTATLEGTQVYIECTMVDIHTSEFHMNQQEKDLIAKVRAIESSDYYVTGNAEGHVRRYWRKSDVQKQVQQLLECDDLLPCTVFQDEYGRIEFIRHERNRIREDKRLHPVFYGGLHRGGAIDDAQRVRDKIEEKANKYGALSAPYIVAVNAEYFDLDPEVDELVALFGYAPPTRDGQSGVIRSVNVSGSDYSFTPDSIWLRNNERRHEGLNAVWMFRNAAPWNIRDDLACLYISPWSDMQDLPQGLTRLSHTKIHFNESMGFSTETFDGMSVARLL